MVVFIANSHKDYEWGKKISKALAHAGIDIWSAERSIPTGTDWQKAILEGLRSADAIVGVISRFSRESGWVKNELEYAINAGIPLIPVLVDDAEPIPELGQFSYFDLRNQADVPPSFARQVQESLDKKYSREVKARQQEPPTNPLVELIFRALGNEQFSNAIDELAEKFVLLLGNFHAEHKWRLVQLQAILQRHDLHAVLFDFVKPRNSDYGETVRLLAGMAGFVVADLNAPRSVLMELQLIVPTLSTPVVPILEKRKKSPALFGDLRKYDWLLDPVEYNEFADLLSHVEERVISPAFRKRDQLSARKAGTAAT